MVDITISRNTSEFDQFQLLLSGLYPGEVEIHTANEYKVAGGLLNTVDEATGHDLRYDNKGVPISGTLTGWTENYLGEIVKIEGVNVSAAHVAYVGKTNKWADDIHLLQKILSGDDTITGGANQETLYGYSGDDVLTGGKGDDTLVGALGRDTLNGGAGSNSLVGGDGRDTFVFARYASGYSLIDDFHANGKDHDVIDLRSFDSIHKFSQLWHHMTEFGGDTTLTIGHISFDLLRISIRELDGHDFIFA